MYPERMSETDDDRPDVGDTGLPAPSEFPRFIVNRGLFGIPAALRFWRREDTAAA